MNPEYQHKCWNPELHARAVNHFGRFFGIGTRSPDEALLHSILKAFSRIPYENLSKIIKFRKNRDGIDKFRMPAEVMQDHHESGLGGTCFSLTFFLQMVMTRYGFENYPVMADMRWGDNVHCALVVSLDGPCLVDPGYLFTQPMRLPRDSRRIFRTEFSGVELSFEPDSGLYHLRTFDREQVKWRYRFRNRAVAPERFMEYWMDSFRWNSMHGLCLNRVTEGKMTYIHKNFMRETGFEGKRNIPIKGRVHRTIHEVFGIRPELTEEALAALEDNLAWERERGIWKPVSGACETEGGL